MKVKINRSNLSTLLINMNKKEYKANINILFSNPYTKKQIRLFCDIKKYSSEERDVKIKPIDITLRIYKKENNTENQPIESASMSNISNTVNPKNKSIESYISEINEELKPTLNPNNDDYLSKLSSLSRTEQRIEFFKHLLMESNEEMKKSKYNQKILLSLLILFIGLFALWVPLYRVICEHAGLLVKTTKADYKEDNKKVNTQLKFRVNFLYEVDDELPWEFYPQQDYVYINPGETCLIFYKARNKTDKPIVGLSVYDVQPQSCALYFSKIQCFCFQNQLLGPNEEVDFPVLFYLDPAIQDDRDINNSEYYRMSLKYTFYYAKYQDVAVIMQKHLEKEKENEKILNEKKKEMNIKLGFNKYNLSEENFNTLPGLNPSMKDYYIDEGSKINIKRI